MQHFGLHCVMSTKQTILSAVVVVHIFLQVQARPNWMYRTLYHLAPKTVHLNFQLLESLFKFQLLLRVRNSFSVVNVLTLPQPAAAAFFLVRWERRFLQPVPLQLNLGQGFSSQPDMSEQRFLVEYAKRGTAGCKKCKDKIQKGIVRIGKIVPNPFSESAGEMKEWYHVKCMFEKLERARATTKKIEDLTELEGWEELQDEDKEIINKHVSGIFLHLLHCVTKKKIISSVCNVD